MAELLQMYLILISISVATLFIVFYFLNKKSLHANLLPGPKPLPLVGNIFCLGDKPHRSLARLAKTYGPIVSLKLGQVTTIVISSPELARKVLVKDDRSFCSRSIPDAFRILDHHSASVAWLPANQQWKDLRMICSTRLFNSQRLEHNTGLREQKVRELVEFIKERGRAGQPVDVGRAAFMTALNLISNTLFSIDMVDSHSDSAQEFRDLMQGIMEEGGSANISDFYPVVRVLDLQGRRGRTEVYFKKLHKIFDELIDQRVRDIELGYATSKDFLDAIINYHGDDGEKKLDRFAMKSLLLDLFVAGSDTSSDTVEWAMAELLGNPDKMAKAREELAKAFENEAELNESRILRLPYLQAVVKETLRLHPPAPFLVPRRTVADTELCGYNIPKHSQVLVNAWAIGNDENVWKDARLFMPGREVLGERSGP